MVHGVHPDTTRNPIWDGHQALIFGYAVRQLGKTDKKIAPGLGEKYHPMHLHERDQSGTMTNDRCHTKMAAVILCLLVLLCDFDPCQADKTCASRGSGEDGSCPATQSSQRHENCGIWYARSSLPGDAGIGVFAGIDFQQGQLLPTGDLPIPIVDKSRHGGRKWRFLWNAYNWNADLMHMDTLAKEVDVASPGYGSVTNSFIDLQNIHLHAPASNAGGLHRSKHPGAGAITPYHNRTVYAADTIKSGQELFVSYGDRWFLRRTKQFGPLPITGDLGRANTLVQKIGDIWTRHKSASATPGATADKDHRADEMFAFFWEKVVLPRRHDIGSKSRVVNALPEDWEGFKYAASNGLVGLRKNQLSHSPEWLEQHGICADNIVEGSSTIPGAGRGGFAGRPMDEGARVAPLPMIHVPYRNKLDVQHESNDKTSQLLVNYCFGHRDSTLLLCPYGSLTGLVNHAPKEKANVRLEWSDPSRSYHHPEYLQKSVADMNNAQKAVVAMELIATRPIEEGEELLLDYGQEWEDAWKQHVKTWKPIHGAGRYISSGELNAMTDKPLRTMQEQMKNPYPKNVALYFDMSFLNKAQWEQSYGWDDLEQFKQDTLFTELIRCKLLASKQLGNGKYSYTVLYREGSPPAAGMPREAFLFRDNPYSTDIFLPNSFRHDIRIPDELFPDSWKNRPTKR